MRTIGILPRRYHHQERQPEARLASLLQRPTSQRPTARLARRVQATGPSHARCTATAGAADACRWARPTSHYRTLNQTLNNMSTNHITIGRDVHLTLAIINGLRERQAREQRWQRRLEPLSGFLRHVSRTIRAAITKP